MPGREVPTVALTDLLPAHDLALASYQRVLQSSLTGFAHSPGTCHQVLQPSQLIYILTIPRTSRYKRLIQSEPSPVPEPTLTSGISDQQGVPQIFLTRPTPIPGSCTCQQVLQPSLAYPAPSWGIHW